MSGLLILRVLLFAGECFLASLLLPVLAFAATALMRRAALRHLIWTTMFGVLALLPLVMLLLPPRQIVEHVSAPLSMPATSIAAPVAAAAPDLFSTGNAVLLLVALWLAGVCWQLLRLGLGALGLVRLRRRSAAFATEIKTRCAVRLAADQTGPSTFGLLRPVILLPVSASEWSAVRLEAVLRHEAAHVARRDTISQFIVRLVCALYWLNPLLWLAARSARRAAEIAADDDVLAGGMTPSLYAAELLGLAAESRDPAPGLAMAAPPLAQRVQSVLAEQSSRKGVSKMDMAKTISFGLAATLLLGAARFDIAVAQDAPVKADAVVATAPEATASTPKIIIVAQPLTKEAKRQIEVQAADLKAQAVDLKAQAVDLQAQAGALAGQKVAMAANEAHLNAMNAQVQAWVDRERAEENHMRLAEAVPPVMPIPPVRPRLHRESIDNQASGSASANAQNSNSNTDDGKTESTAVDTHGDATPGMVIQTRKSSTNGNVAVRIELNDAITQQLARLQPELRKIITKAVGDSEMMASKEIDIAIAKAKLDVDAAIAKAQADAARAAKDTAHDQNN